MNIAYTIQAVTSSRWRWVHCTDLAWAGACPGEFSSDLGVEYGFITFYNYGLKWIDHDWHGFTTSGLDLFGFMSDLYGLMLGFLDWWAVNIEKTQLAKWWVYGWYITLVKPVWLKYIVETTRERDGTPWWNPVQQSLLGVPEIICSSHYFVILIL